nr:ATP-dependent RecD-like DNA helicase [bacterium]
PAARSAVIRLDDGREIEYDAAALEDIELAYCMSVHKSQGSEYPAVVIALCDGPPRLLSMNLVYTALTRARRLCVFCGSDRQVARMASNRRQADRISALRVWLQEGQP